MKERIKTLAFRKKYSAAAAAIMTGCAVLLAACSFTGSKTPEEPKNVPAETAIQESVAESTVQKSTEEYRRDNPGMPVGKFQPDGADSC